LQVDFMATIHGVRSFEGLRDRASRIEIGGTAILVASLEDIIKSKRAARRSRDLAVLEILEKTLEESSRPQNSARGRQKRIGPRAD
jgi:predicted nucleotidyltransferase